MVSFTSRLLYPRGETADTHWIEGLVHRVVWWLDTNVSEDFNPEDRGRTVV